MTKTVKTDIALFVGALLASTVVLGANVSLADILKALLTAG